MGFLRIGSLDVFSHEMGGDGEKAYDFFEGPRRRSRLKEWKRAEAGFGWRLNDIKSRFRRRGAV
ncbi:hypothetical protein COLO4_29974 [Corchorus olitorius]|uniref:Uncharacterized protein n=1 Tax=Corchorus olitorius TaxID=93759 RepID=A0A1R3HC10_9ROSI|nr:hypothetical protein COLO4_29974 [Corchorus olitorius]